jgi:hypothetical protein
VKSLPIVALWLAAAALPLQGATLERLSLDDMIGKSTAIVRGTVTESWAAYTGRDIYTHYKIQVAERFKGSAGQKVIEIAVPGGVVGELHQTVAGSPILEKGQQYVLFLWTGKNGVTWITGFTQGLFSLTGDGAEPTASRSASRELMLDPSSGLPVKDTAVSLKLNELRTRIAARLSVGGVQ